MANFSYPLGPPHPSITAPLMQAQYRIPELGMPEWLNAPAPGGEFRVDISSNVNTNLAASRDLNVVAFNAEVSLVPGSYPRSVFVVRRNGQIEVGSVLPNGDYNNTRADLANTQSSLISTSPPALSNRNQLSPDGRFLLFTAGASGVKELYVRDLELGVTIKLASQALNFQSGGTWMPGVSAQPQAATVQSGYAFAASDAPVAFFRSAESLTEDADSTSLTKIFEANLETGDITYRSEINGPPVGVSPDGRRVMFLRPTGAGTQPWEVRMWSADDPNTSQLFGSIRGSLMNIGLVRSVRTSKDGLTWVFTAVGALDSGDTTLSRPQVFRWQVGDARPTCISCESVDGVGRTGGAILSQGEAWITESLRKPNGDPGSSRKYSVAQPSRAISDDGTIIGFDSSERLVEEDINDVRDVYMWDANAPAGEELQLLTSGKGDTPSYFIDVSPSGKNVFFSTQDQLVPEDIDLTYDVYVARVGGGFETPAAPCTGSSCRSSVPETPALPSIGSVAFTSDGNVGQEPALRRASVGVSKRMSVKGSAARLRVRVPGAGRIAVQGPGVQRAVRSVKRSGAYRLRVSLKPGARRLLRKKGRVSVNVRVSYRQNGGQQASKTVKVVFKRAGKGAQTAGKGR